VHVFATVPASTSITQQSAVHLSSLLPSTTIISCAGGWSCCSHCMLNCELVGQFCGGVPESSMLQRAVLTTCRAHLQSVLQGLSFVERL
jgi:hypothetical protein